MKFLNVTTVHGANIGMPMRNHKEAEAAFQKLTEAKKTNSTCEYAVDGHKFIVDTASLVQVNLLDADEQKLSRIEVGAQEADIQMRVQQRIQTAQKFGTPLAGNVIGRPPN